MVVSKHPNFSCIWLVSGALGVSKQQAEHSDCLEDGYVSQRGAGDTGSPGIVLCRIASCLSSIYRQWRKGGRRICHAPAGKGRGGRGNSGALHDNEQPAGAYYRARWHRRIKKANSNSWVVADYNVPLEKGDVIQTGSEGMAKIVFNDGTNYTVKQDSLIVIEENSANEQQQTNVAVAVSTGTVDLSTGTYVQGSKSQVIVEGATASLAPESAAMVHNDPKTDQHEILLNKGTGAVERNGEVVHLADWEKVSFAGHEPTRWTRLKEIGPPTPISPANMMPHFRAGRGQDVEFSWTAMANAAGYRLRISKNPYFSSLVVDRKVEVRT